MATHALPSPRVKARPTPRSVVFNTEHIRQTLNIPMVKETPRGTALCEKISESVAPYLSSALGAVVLVDSRTRVLAFNSLAEELFGYTPNEVNGNSLALLMPLSEKALQTLAETNGGGISTELLVNTVWGIDIENGVFDAVVRVHCNGKKLVDVVLCVSRAYETEGNGSVYVFRFREQVLPKEINTEILGGKKCDNVTLTVIRAVNFSSLLKEVPCDDLLSKLSALFDRIDGITDRYNMTKLRVNGDSYITCTPLSGINAQNHKENANSACDFALHACDISREVTFDGDKRFQLQIGIHTGRVVAGVVDRNPSTVASIDLFGETVSTAHRIQLHGAPDSLHISHPTYLLLDMRFDLRTRGVMHVRDENPGGGDEEGNSENALTYLIPARDGKAKVDNMLDGRRLSAAGGGMVPGPLPNALTEDIEKWSFNVVNHSEKELIVVGYSFFERLGFLEQFNIPPDKMMSFLELVRSCYRDNPYHNFFHAIDVTHCISMFISTGALHEIFDPLDLFSLVLAALCHDLDHPGLSTSFLVRTHDPLAMLYNDKSVLEQHHCTTMYRILMREECNILCSLSPEEWNRMRKKIIGIILATDMELHGDYMRRMGEFVGQYEGNVTSEMEAEKKQFLLEMLMKSADISNIIRPFFIAEIWAEKIQDEFFHIGDSEKVHGFVPLPFMDREKNPQVPMVQKNFISAVGTALFRYLGQVFPNLQYLSDSIKCNLDQWSSRLDSA